jgi:hypothetical protein
MCLNALSRPRASWACLGVIKGLGRFRCVAWLRFDLLKWWWALPMEGRAVDGEDSTRDRWPHCFANRRARAYQGVNA